MEHHLDREDRSRLTPILRNVSRVTAVATRCEARPLPSSASLSMPRDSSPSGARPESGLIQVACLGTRLPGSGTGSGPGSGQSKVPCERAGPRLPAFLIGTPGPTHDACAGCSESIRVFCQLRRPPRRRSSDPAFRGVRRAAALGTGLCGPPSARPLASVGLWPVVRRAACAGQRPASMSRIGWRCQLATHWLSVAPAVSTPCWLMGR